jgi:dienelactone hydrolase
MMEAMMNDLRLNRQPSHRQLLKSVAIPVTLPLCSGLDRFAAAADAYQPLNRFPRMVHEYFVDQVRKAEQRNLRRLERLATAEDAVDYVESVRERIRKCFGPEPERTPLNPRITGVLERDGYRIEKVIFDSRPGFPVTANLYIPTGRDEPLPGVVGTCGHSGNGKAAEAYQSFSQGLARLGYVCLIYDPIGQGERYQYVDDDYLKPRRGGPVAEHLYAGNQQFLVGEFFGAWRAWDGIRALDYLLTREEVDPNRVGVTGNSGGGTMTTWLCGVESRWSMAAPSCFVTTFRRNMENELPADTEQCPPRALALGLDHADFLAAMAPKPVIILAKERDFFDARGGEEAYRRLKRLYALLGKPDQIGMFIGPTTHGYSQENREAMYQWFNGATAVSQRSSEPEITIEPDETLWCTPNGQVAGLGAKTVFDFTRESSAALTAERGKVAGQQLETAVRRVLKLPSPPAQAPDYRILRNWRSRDYPTSHGISYAVETEPGIFAIVYMLTKERWYSRPPQNGRKAILYVSHRSSDAELRDEPLIGEVIEANPDAPLFTCDLRGIGESKPDTCGTNSFDTPYGCDYFYAIHSLMLDRPYVGQKTIDALRVLDWLASVGYDDIHVVAKGWGALPASFASLLNDNVTQVTLKNALISYAEIAQSEQYDWPLSTLLPGVLSEFDLPDCYRALRGKKLRQIEPWGASAT